MAVGDAHVFPGFLTPVITFQSHRLFFLAYFCRPEVEKQWKEISPQPGLELKQPPGHESDTLTTKPSGRETRMSPKQPFVEKCNLYI